MNIFSKLCFMKPYTKEGSSNKDPQVVGRQLKILICSIQKQRGNLEKKNDANVVYTVFFIVQT